MFQDMKSAYICTLMLIFQVFSPAKVIFAGVGVLLSVCILHFHFVRAIVTPASLRLLGMFVQAKKLSLKYSIVLKTFSDASKSTRRYHRLPK